MIGSMPVTDVYTQYYMGGARWITKMKQELDYQNV